MAEYVHICARTCFVGAFYEQYDASFAGRSGGGRKVWSEEHADHYRFYGGVDGLGEYGGDKQWLDRV